MMITVDIWYNYQSVIEFRDIIDEVGLYDTINFIT